MAVWEIGQVQFQRRLDAGWSHDDVTVTSGAFYTFRGFFSIANGDEPINLGHLEVERYVDAAWEIWPGTFARDIEPWHGFSVGDIVVWTGKVFITAGVHTLRMRVDWDGGPYYSSVQGPKAAPLVITGTAASSIRSATANGVTLDVTSRGRSVSSASRGPLLSGVSLGSRVESDSVGRVVAGTARR